MISGLAEILIGFSTLYILYKSPSDDRLGSAIFAFAGLVCFSSGASSIMGKQDLVFSALAIEHYLIWLGIALKLLSTFKKKSRKANIVAIKTPQAKEKEAAHA